MDPMNLHGMSGADVATFVIYDRQRGDIVHVHQIITLPGAKPATVEPEKAALERACTSTRRKAESLAVLKVDRDQLTVGEKCRVDPRKRILQVVSAAPARARSKASKRPAAKTLRKRGS